MTSPSWEALFRNAAGWLLTVDTPETRVGVSDAIAFLKWRGDKDKSREEVDAMYAGLALFARLMSIIPDRDVCESCEFVYGVGHVESPCVHRRRA